MTVAIEVTGVSKTYVNTPAPPVTALNRFSVTLEDGKILAMFGPNGCGKSTLLKICANIMAPDAGSVRIHSVEPGQARVGYIPQSYSESLFPWLTMLDNIAFPLRAIGMSRRRARVLTQKRLSELRIEVPFWHHPYQCSAGQRQMAALARALVSLPAVLLADEPFSALDYAARLRMQARFLEVISSICVATVFVTHDVQDAVFLADSVMIMSGPPLSHIHTLRVDLPRPREPAIRADPRFLQLAASAVEYSLNAQ